MQAGVMLLLLLVLLHRSHVLYMHMGLPSY